MATLFTQQILSAAGLRYQPYRTPIPGTVFITAANQLIGSYANLKRFQDIVPHYRNWQAHHIVEAQDLLRLGVSHLFPPREEQTCVLLPERAHIGRINSVLRNQNPQSIVVSSSELLRAYRDAYALIGDYSGGGEAQIGQELLAIVRAVFRRAGLS